MDTLPLIITPPAQKWREFRIRYLPVVVFFVFFIWAGTLWKNNIASPTTTGQTESIIANVITPESGFLTNLFVARYQSVKMGEPIAEIIVTDFRAIDLKMTQLRTKITLAQAELGTILDQDRLAFDFESLRLDLNRELVNIEATRAELTIMDKSVKALEKGVKDLVVPQLMLENSLRSRDGLSARLQASQTHTAILEAKLKDSRFFTESFASKTKNARATKLIQEIESEREQLNLNVQGKIIVRSPVNGRVNTISSYPGQNIIAGESIADIVSEETPRIIGFLHAPLPFEPQDGMEVTVRRRSKMREQGLAKISAVGPQMEPVTQALLRPGVNFEIALPIAVNIPKGMKLFPGELVDLIIEQNR